MADIAVQIEKDIEELSSLEKLDWFLKLTDFYYVERCENIDYSNCLFVINLRYLYVQNAVVKYNSVAPLQKYCRLKYDNFHSVRLLLRSLGAVQKERVKLDEEFQEILEIWNKPPLNTVQWAKKN